MESGGDFLQSKARAELESNLTEEYGHLVAQILETQKELINTNNVDVIPKKVEIVRK